MSPEQTNTTTVSVHAHHWSSLADGGVAVALSLVFLKNYWVSEDAYLNFRSVDQLLQGHGPIWNPHERVQVFTSPLWYGLHALVQALVHEAYLAVFLLSCVCFGLTLFWLRRCVGSGLAFGVAGLLLMSSNAVFDYASSGQENVLGYCLSLLALSRYLQLSAKPPQRDDKRALLELFGAAGAMLVCRHDLLVLIGPLLLYAAWSRRSVIDRRTGVLLIAALSAPLVIWSLFSLVYYGSAFPNPAYAKLSAGFPRGIYVQYGVQYLSVLARYDALSLVSVAAALGLLIWQRTAASTALAVAIILHLFYVVYVGGDYMQGRFVSFEILLACALLARLAPTFLEGSVRVAVPLILVMYGFAYARTPLNTPFDQPKPAAGQHEPGRDFVMDARATLGVYTSLYSYLQAADLSHYPEHPLAIEGRKFARSAQPVTVVHAGGMFGWAAGTAKIIVEAHGIADPLLARLPASAFRGIGHYARYRPEGYMESLASGKPQLADADLNAYYTKLALITQSRPLWTWQRLETILLFNLNAYDPLLQHFVREKILGKQQLPASRNAAGPQ